MPNLHAALLRACHLVLAIVRDMDEPDSLDTLAQLTALQMAIDTARDHLVAELRDQGVSWATIADTLGVTRQAAHQRWAHMDPNAGDD